MIAFHRAVKGFCCKHAGIPSVRLAVSERAFLSTSRQETRCNAFPDATATKNSVLAEDLLERFRAADLDGNGLLDKDEFLRVAESTAMGMEYAMFHWLDTSTVDELFEKYSREEGDAITFESFRRLAEDGALLEGRLTEYRSLFQKCLSWKDQEGTLFGTIDKGDITRLASMLEHPLHDTEAQELVDNFCSSDKVCNSDDDRLSFEDFLNLFRDHLLDLQNITEYLKLEAIPQPECSPEERAEAEKRIPVPERGVYVIESSEQFDAFIKLHPDRVVVLLAGLSWCRPCKSLTRPLEKLAAKYDGAVFVKVLGDTNDNTKRFFKNTLSVKATPHLSFWRKGTKAFWRTGANKSKLEDAIRRFYNCDVYKLPEASLYPATA